MRGAGTAKIASLLLAGISTCGCVTSGPWGGSPEASPYVPAATAASLPAPANNATAPTSAAPATPTPTSPSTPLGQATQPGTPLGLPAPSMAIPYPTSMGAAILASLRETRDLLLDAVAIEPHVTPAADPVRLDSQPANAQAVSADLHYHAGRMFESSHSWSTAASHYQSALARSPNDVRLLISHARAQDRLGNFAEAEATYRRAIELSPNDTRALNDLAMCYARQQNWDAAIGNLQRAIRLDPSNPLYRNNLALILVDAGRPYEAFEHLVTAHGEAIAHYNLGHMLLQRNLPTEAEQHFRRALELNPQLAEAQKMLGIVQPTTAGTISEPADDTATTQQSPLPMRAALVPTRLPTTSGPANSAGYFGNSLR